MPLTPSQIERFHRDGYLLLDFAIEPEVADAVIRGVSPHYQNEGEGAIYRGGRIQDAWLFDAAVRRLALEPRILEALQALFGRRPLPFQTLNFPVGTEQKVHSDTIHFNSQPGGYMAGVWVALEDVDERNGALIYYPGSHKLPEITLQDVGVAPAEENYPHYENHIESLIAEQGLRAERGVMRKGEIFIWHANLLHGGGPQTDKSRSRHSQVTHYFFEGCRYYTPMLSSESHTQWRNPEWITANTPYIDPARLHQPPRKPLLKRLRRRVKAALGLQRKSRR